MSFRDFVDLSGIEVSAVKDKNGIVFVSLVNAEQKIGVTLCGISGRARDIDSAIEHICRRISCAHIVINAMSEKRSEVFTGNIAHDRPVSPQEFSK